MKRISGKIKIALALMVGIGLFTADLLLNILTSVILELFGFFLVLFVVGMVSGGVKNGLLSALLLLVVMIPIGILLYPYVSGMPTTGDLTAMILFVMVALMCRPALDIEGDPFGICVVLMILVALIAAFAPGMYFAGFLVGGLGGALSPPFWRLFEKGVAEDKPGTTEAP